MHQPWNYFLCNAFLECLRTCTCRCRHNILHSLWNYITLCGTNLEHPRNKSRAFSDLNFNFNGLQWSSNLDRHAATHKSLVWYHVGAVWGGTLEVSAFSLSTWRHTYTPLWSVRVWIRNRKKKIWSMSTLAHPHNVLSLFPGHYQILSRSSTAVR